MNEHDDVWERPVSRRGFMAVSALAAMAAASGGRLGADALAATESDAASGTLFYYNWADYVNPKTYSDFTKASGIKVKKDFYVSNEALLAKLKGGARGYDLAVPTGYMVQILASEKLLMPIDWKKIPNATKYANPKFRRLPFDPKDQWSVIKDWGTTGYMYRKDLVKERPTTWRQFVNLAKTKYSGKVTVLDGIPECVGSMLVMLGYSYNSDNARELNEAKEELIALKPHLLSITSTEYKQLLVSGKAVMSLGWNGDAAAAGHKKPVTYVVAKESGEFWVDSYVIPVGAKNPDAAHAWIDYVFRPKANSLETQYTLYGSALKPAVAKTVLPKTVLANPAVFPPPATLAKMEPNNVSAKGNALRNRIWTEFKAA